MEYKQIGANSIKISLTYQDLEEHDVKMSDFFENQEIIEQLFYELVEELGLEERFSASTMLTFQVQPNPKGVTLLVSEDFDFANPPQFPQGMNDDAEIGEAMEDFFHKLSEAGQKHGLPALDPENFGLGNLGKEADKSKQKQQQEEADYVYYSVRFDNASELIAAAKNVKMAEEESELYRYQGDFYLVIMDDQKSKGRVTVENNRARMMEYGEDTDKGRDVLLEYGESLIKSKALQVLSKI
ncbi:adaptor protein MecA [Lactococcus termiticola]|uniref:Adapter protein MecA n=1 Tax=Lactococcus termiticola TaxID=2169526 RepID=A0A2R5HKT3_9LACT|nr:adaptor protein MecA [Lactococcus termiticola]GBG97548.1 adapter protein MecA [Lactococcus termiticola]